MRFSLVILLIFTASCIADKPRSLNYSYDPSRLTSSFDNLGIINNYTQAPVDFTIRIDCSFYDFEMNLLFEMGNGYLCKRIHFDSPLPILAPVQYWGLSDEESFKLFNLDGKIKWEIKAPFSHDFTYSAQKHRIYTIQRDEISVAEDIQQYFNIVEYSEKGELIRSWSAREHLQELIALKPSLFKPGLLPNERRIDLHPNFLHYFERPWKSGDGKVIPSNSLGIYLAQLHTLIVFDENYKIIWSYDFDMFIHTPNFLDSGQIIVFTNRDIKTHNNVDSIDIFDTSSPGKREIFFPLDHHGLAQRGENSINGSVQVLNDESLFISLGSDEGGVLHLSKNKEVLFHWTAPASTKNITAQTYYRAGLIPTSWIEGFLSPRSKN